MKLYTVLSRQEGYTWIFRPKAFFDQTKAEAYAQRLGSGYYVETLELEDSN